MKTEVLSKTLSIDGSNYPTQPGWYITDHGYIEFDGTNFLLVLNRIGNRGSQKVATVISWWLKPKNG